MLIHSIQAAAERLNQGDLVAFPTETVFGLGADAENPQAVAKIYQIKERPSNHPVIVHLAPEADLSYWAKQIPHEAELLIKAFWPGPLTLILQRAAHIPAAVSGGQSTVGLRCPSHPVAQALLREFAEQRPNGQGGLAAPSANKFGQVSPTASQHVMNEFATEIAADELWVLDGGASEVGIESTIVDLSRLGEGVPATLLRPGHITRQQLSEVLGYEPRNKDAAAPQVSGSLKAHYAPKTLLQWLPASEEAISALIQSMHGDATVTAAKWAVLVFDPTAYPAEYESVDYIAMPRDPQQYAQRLYALLRDLDKQGYARLAVQPLPEDESWEAINDRLQRAAAAFEG
ncbi:L-threonylcarbamoyladenylate synthase [Oligella urethralis]|uniref:Threonylcarbamoyl-AMP synthase n=1 Tax=Oligella urethralis DNF00040 TaxID=1401065 RepID=A0A095Z8V6_9BURK|nr:L-threonylcarbamoyladenylate synthase [Oligella urethralis]KGF31170.1 translation factor Sua5 [Oligella urethralis DNF00040]